MNRKGENWLLAQGETINLRILIYNTSKEFVLQPGTNLKEVGPFLFYSQIRRQ